ncbi:Gfo/Idh/MocA family oxidoreductase [Microbacterium sp. Au-Mic1]|uniref:Gfo/Idh/MocA family protein n=1 Tax=Microbacterium sp. Au-Mic1 TaxID=2906457 RepID=UPI001E29F8C2|nr:Gfo/Idh/MocA family oxidoreductase [Microbacterium sp. Au-Mic1]MCE4026223.1 Gfo/Idh/MocA family oxidoreductase [Microbacterium sp. Au-Mic1]
MIRVGILGSGFIADCYADSLLDVREAVLTANYSRNPDRATAFATRWKSRTHHTDMTELCASADVDLVVIALPNEAHVEAVRLAASAGKAVICTKPLARTGAEAAEILRIVREAGVWHGYAESSVFSPSLQKAHQMAAAGGIGELLTMRAREAHSGPHAPHFWDAMSAGGGALLDMGCHTVESARHFFGKDNPVVEVFAHGATVVHGDKTTGEDTAVALLKFEGGQLAIIESAWTEKGGMQLRHEFVGTGGRLVTDTSVTSVWGFIEKPVGHLVEKSGADTGWVYPVPEETRAYGFSQQMRHFVQSFETGRTPLETFEDGWVVNCILDACYRSMSTRTWEPVTFAS